MFWLCMNHLGWHLGWFGMSGFGWLGTNEGVEGWDTHLATPLRFLDVGLLEVNTNSRTTKFAGRKNHGSRTREGVKNGRGNGLTSIALARGPPSESTGRLPSGLF